MMMKFIKNLFYGRGYDKALADRVERNLKQGQVKCKRQDSKYLTKYIVDFEDIRVYLKHIQYIKFEQEEDFRVEITDEKGDMLFLGYINGLSFNIYKLKKGTLMKLIDYICELN